MNYGFFCENKMVSWSKYLKLYLSNLQVDFCKFKRIHYFELDQLTPKLVGRKI